MKKIVFFLSRSVYFFLFLFAGSTLFDLSSLRAQEESSPGRGLKYYLQLRKDEFLWTMIPKERFLLGIVQDVNEEVRERKVKGVRISDLGIDEVVSPGEIIVNEYVQELHRVAGLLDEIAELERKAKQKVNLQVLEALSGLKNRVREIIEGGNLPGRVAQQSEVSGGIANLKASSVSEVFFEEQAGPDDLFEQWKYNCILDYKVKLTEYQFLRTRLLNTATPSQEKRMFRRDLKRALESYSNVDFALSRLQLQDVLDTYTQYRFLDDVLFYCSESSYGLNYLDKALEGYRRLVTEYPESPFCAKALVKIIYIYYIYGEFGRLSETYRQLLTHGERLDSESLGTVSYVVGYAHFKAGEYKKALKTLGNVASGLGYFFPSLYLSAACYSNLNMDDLALSIYHRLIEEKNKGDRDPVLAQIKNNALLKLGLIYYERGENQRATGYFDLVSKNFLHYDLSIIGKAWSAYRSGKPGEALRNVEWLLRHSLVSDYAYEAKVLAASSKDLLGRSEEAIEDLKQVYQIGRRADWIKKIPSDRIALLQNIQGIEEYQRGVLDDRDREMFAEVEQIRRFLESSTTGLKTIDSGRKELEGNFREVKEKLAEKIEALDRLEEQARERGEDAFLQEIRRLRSDLIQTLQNHTERYPGVVSDPEEDPLIRRMGMAEYLKYIFRSLLLQTLREKEQTKKSIQEAGKLLEEAQKQDKFEFVIRMEIKKEELQDFCGKLNQYEVWLRENFPRESRVELDRWTTFSGYGISNINFSRIKESERRIAQVSQTIEALGRVFRLKRKELENRIQGLLSDVATIEEQMRLEVERREQQEKEQFFKGEYFDRQRQESAAGKLQEKPESKEKSKK